MSAAVENAVAEGSVAPSPRVQRRPDRRAYQALSGSTWVAGLGLTAWFLSATAGAAVPAATLIGRWYGLVGSLLFLFLTLYGLRRVFYAGGMGSLEWWYRAHLMLGVLALVLVGCHSGFSFRSAFLGTLQICFWGSILTGVLGWAQQTAMTRRMVRSEARPTVLSDLNAERAQLKQRLSGAEATAETARLRDELAQVEKARGEHILLRGWTTAHLLLAAVGFQLLIWHIVVVATSPR